jgi:hypothetical protein
MKRRNKRTEQPKVKEEKNIWEKLWSREVTDKINMYNVLPITIEELHELLNTNPYDKTKTTTIEELLKGKYRLVRIDDKHSVCPHCGYDCSDWADKAEQKSLETDKPIKRNKVVSFSNWTPAYDFYSGASGVNWTEKYKCPKCAFKFTEDNSSI